MVVSPPGSAATVGYARSPAPRPAWGKQRRKANELPTHTLSRSHESSGRELCNDRRKPSRATGLQSTIKSVVAAQPQPTVCRGRLTKSSRSCMPVRTGDRRESARPCWAPRRQPRILS